MTEYRYEYGQRWNAQLPRNDIKLLVKRMHCAIDDNKVVAAILAHCKRSNIPGYMLSDCKRYALCVHHEQKMLYFDVLREL